MIVFKRSPENPILVPDKDHAWESRATFNGCPVKNGSKIHFLYRATSEKSVVEGHELEMSSIGYAESSDGIHFRNRRQLIKPEYDWEKFGCEDPRVTKIGGRYFIFYTTLSNYPFNADGIKIGLAITKDFKKIEEKHPVTFFNSKAMALFPEKIGGKFAAILTVHTDRPPAKICMAMFDRVEDIWSRDYWAKWYTQLDLPEINLQRNPADQVEVGAPPLKTKSGWLVLYSYIYNYFSAPRIFGVEAALLDMKDPRKILARTAKPLLVPQEEYEEYGRVPHVVFPSGALVQNGKLMLYYGAADSTCAVAFLPMKNLMAELTQDAKTKLIRCDLNPILKPLPEHPWESKAVFNPAAIKLNDKIHLVYRATSENGKSTLGYAASRDGFTFSERLPDPIYVPRENFENFGCEDPRLTKIGDKIYMCYTAFDGQIPRVALSWISAKNFAKKNWQWSKPLAISPPGIDDKDAAIFPKKIGGNFALLHRLGGTNILIDFVSDLKFQNKFLGGKILLDLDDYEGGKVIKIGLSTPPIETKRGWLLLYHGVSESESYYIKAALLDRHDPTKIIAHTINPILEPVMPYEKEGVVPNVVFPCGAVILDKNLVVYYGGADKVVAAASVRLKDLVENLIRIRK